MQFAYMLAPLEDTSDNALRTLCHRYGADITFTEMARTDSLARRKKSTLQRTQIYDETPVWIQITGAQDNVLKIQPVLQKCATGKDPVHNVETSANYPYHETLILIV